MWIGSAVWSEGNKIKYLDNIYFEMYIGNAVWREGNK